jgi:hypothetical protein
MRTATRFVLATLPIFTLAAFELAGCASTGMERSTAATTTMKTVDADIQALVTQLDATGASLQDVIRPGQGDVKAAFNSYSGNVKKMEAMEKRFSTHADEMKLRGKDYFTEWKKEGDAYKNPQIQALSDQRRMQLGDVYGRIAENSTGVKDAFRTYVSDAKEVQTFLSTDLTSKGIESIAPVSRKVVDDGDQLKYAIKNIQNAIEDARAEMTQNGI